MAGVPALLGYSRCRAMDDFEAGLQRKLLEGDSAPAVGAHVGILPKSHKLALARPASAEVASSVGSGAPPPPFKASRAHLKVSSEDPRGPYASGQPHLATARPC
jgi:hypothetical protein